MCSDCFNINLNVFFNFRKCFFLIKSTLRQALTLSRGMYHKTLWIRNVQIMNRLTNKLVLFPFCLSHSLVWINALAYYRISTLRIRYVSWYKPQMAALSRVEEKEEKVIRTDPKIFWLLVFNSKLVSFVLLQIKCIAHTQPLLELKTQPKFSPIKSVWVLYFHITLF